MTNKDLDDAFQKLKEEGKHTLENVMNLLKNNRVFDEKFTETHARSYLNDSSKGHVDMDKFKEILTKVTSENSPAAGSSSQKEDGGGHSKDVDKKKPNQPAAGGGQDCGKFMTALSAGIEAFMKAWKK